MTAVNRSNDEEIERIRKSNTVKGLSGLRNLGNTCYMNAGIQCLFATNMLTAFIIEKKFIDTLKRNKIHDLAEEERKKQKLSNDCDILVDRSSIIKNIKNSVTYAYFKTLRTWLSDNYIVEPCTLKQTIGASNSLFRGYSQQDSQELLNCVLDTIHEDLKSPVKLNYVGVSKNIFMFRDMIKQYQKMMKNVVNDDDRADLLKAYRIYLDEHKEEYAINSALEYWEKYIRPSHSVIRDLFTGMTYTETKCNDCKITSLAFEPFIMSSIAIPKSNNTPVELSQCLRQHCAKVMLVDKNKYQCSNCKDYRDASQTTYMWEVPEILIIHLKRFTSEMIGNFCRTEKNSTKINFPLTDLDMSEYISPYNKKEAKYELYAVTQQFGSLNGGHYIACCKNSINNNWYEFDDSNVTFIEKDKVQSHIVSSNAYILFYKKMYQSLDDDE